ncbi:MAG: stage III sporulation protein AA [Clostridia bacterium]|nr:stage III sporulation protein AA [Clostridia bacterium]
MERSWLNVLPERLKGPVAAAVDDTVEEIRIAVGKPILLTGKNRRVLEHIAAMADCEMLMELICGHSVFAHESELRECYVTLEDGSRVGLAGKITDAGMTMPHSFNIRLARQIMGAADDFMDYICGNELCSALLLSEPGAGKTTLLRDGARQLSNKGYRVAIADERGEIAAAVNGIPALDVGRADVMGGCRKAKAMALLMRGMSPEIIITDEIATEEDAEAVLDASGCGVKVIASAHGGGSGILRRKSIRRIVKEGAFDRILLLKKQGSSRRITDITGEVICGYLVE